MATNSSGSNFFSPSYFNSAVKVALTNDSGYVVLGSFTGAVPTDTNVYSIGCILIQETTGLSYQNTGSIASPSFTAMGGGNPAYIVKFAGKRTTTGGSATEAFTVTGVLSTDIVLATLQTAGGTPRTLLTSAPTTNTITLVFSGDPSTDHIVSYEVLRIPA